MPLVKITSLPTRYEPLINTFGDKARTTFVAPATDLDVIKRFVAGAESAGQGKLMFLHAPSGSGKSTFVHSLEIFLAEQVSQIVRMPPPHELAVADIPAYVAKLPAALHFTVLNFDGREAPFFNEPEYQTFLGLLNGILRSRRDILILWPVTDRIFAEKLVGLLEKVGGRSAFSGEAIATLGGLKKDQYRAVLEKILQIANWTLEDAAISTAEVDQLISESDRIGSFLDRLHDLIAQRFNVQGMGVTFPTLVIAISSGESKLREVCRSLRRADSFYIEASRLLMYTKKSNVAEWWANRASDMKSALPHVIALFNAQLVSLSAASVVHSVLQFGTQDLQQLVQGVRADRGNARRIIAYSELFKFASGEAVDNREYGSNVKDETVQSYERIQAASEVKHKEINQSVLGLIQDAGVTLKALEFESTLAQGILTDASFKSATGSIALEFHHKAASEANSNRIAIYVLEKLQEYAINYGLAKR